MNRREFGRIMAGLPPFVDVQPDDGQAVLIGSDGVRVTGWHGHPPDDPILVPVMKPDITSATPHESPLFHVEHDWPSPRVYRRVKVAYRFTLEDPTTITTFYVEDGVDVVAVCNAITRLTPATIPRRHPWN